MNLDKETFAKLMQKRAHIKIGFGMKIFSEVYKSLNMTGVDIDNDQFKQIFRASAEEIAESIHKSSYITKYGQQLFNCFCHDPDMRQIPVHNFNSLPRQLLDVLFPVNEE
eukprot:233938_1